MKLFKREKSNTYFDLSFSDRKKIVKNAIREANMQQLDLVMGQEKRMTECCSRM